MSRTIPMLLALALAVLLVAVCAAPDPGLSLTDDGREGRHSAVIAQHVQEFDVRAAERTGLTPETASALREMVLAAGRDVRDVMPAIQSFGVTQRSWGSDLIALLTALGETEAVARALVRSGCDVEAAERMLVETPGVRSLWSTFLERRAHHQSELAESLAPGRSRHR